MITITTYRELTDFVVAFGDGHLNMVVICSRGGLGKSEEARRTLDGEDVVRIGGHVTPLKLYELLYEGRDKPVVFDEIDGLLANPRHGGLGYFNTRSHVLMLCNSFSALSANVAACA